MNVEVRHLRCFLAIAEEGNVTRAAAALHLTQPALSRTLAQLEQQLGARLVDRSTHHLRLTPAGQRFQLAAASAVRAFDLALASVAADSPRLRLGLTWSTATYTAAIVRAWNSEHPQRPLIVRRSDERTGGLAYGEVDVALVHGPVTDSSLRTALLDEEPRVAALPAGHRLAAATELTLADLAGEALIVNTVAGTTTPELWPAGARPVIGGDSETIDDWLVEIASGTGVGVTAASTPSLHPHPGVRFVPLVGAPPIPMLLAWPARDAHPDVRELVRLAARATRALVASTS
jgi:DNA-binding transcriptional LysR family regulator